MKGRQLLGALVFLVGLLLLYLLRGVLISLIVLVIGFIGVLIAFALIIVGAGMMFWSGRRWRVSW